MGGGEPSVLVIACGALAHEIVALKRLNGWSALDIQCLPPELHNRPEQIPAAVRAAIDGARLRYPQIFVAYADCGTGGRLDAMLAEEGIELEVIDPRTIYPLDEALILESVRKTHRLVIAHEACTTFGLFFMIDNQTLPHMAVFFGQADAHRRHHDAVLHVHLIDATR